MTEEEKRYSKQILGKTVITKSGKKFGEVGNISFETRTGELIQIILKNPTSYTEGLELEKDPEGDYKPEFVKKILKAARSKTKGIRFTTPEVFLKRIKK